MQFQTGNLILPRIPPPCFRKLGRHIRRARAPHTLRVADIVRTYILQIGYLVSSFAMLYDVCTRTYEEIESTAQQHSKHIEKETENFENTTDSPVPTRAIIICLIGTP